MRKIVCGLMVALSLSACGEAEKGTENSKPVVKIGVTVPLTGNGAQAGLSTRAAMNMVYEKLPKESLKYDYQLIFEDNQMNGVKTATTTQKLISVDKVRAVFAQWGMMANIASNIAKEKNVIGMFCAYGENPNQGKHNFNANAAYNSQAEAMISALKQRKIKKIALFIDNSDVRDQYDALLRRLESEPEIQVVYKEYFNMGEKDYRSAISKAQEQSPEMYFISGYPPSPFLFIKQLKEITGRNDNVTGFDAIGEIDASVREIANGLWYIDSNLGGIQKFQDELATLTGEDNSSCSGSLASNLQILVAAFENAPVKEGEVLPDNDAVSEWILQNVKKYPTVSGDVTVFPSGFIDTPVSVKEIRNGQRVIIGE